ncbi:hypothetical protein HCU40_12560 [Pseudanabaena biceps]|nr:hypothetical protein [Pseudanabaena biceps]
MSIPPPYPKTNLDDILVELSTELELEDMVEKIPLTRALEQLLQFAQAHNLADIAQLVKQELDGYTSQPPAYRYINLNYFDTGGQPISGLKPYCSYPLVTGVRKLEIRLKNGLSLMLPDQILKFLLQVSGVTVDVAHVSSSEINILLKQIRHELICKIREIQREGN